VKISAGNALFLTAFNSFTAPVIQEIADKLVKLLLTLLAPQDFSEKE